jgi:hypothetical protein
LIGQEDQMARDGAIWHVAIDGEQLGPLTKFHVLQYVEDGRLTGDERLTGDDLIWRAGFAN